MRDDIVVNVDEVAEILDESGPWRSTYKPLTPALAPRMGRLGVNLCRVGPGQSACPFHTHQLEDEVFYVLSGHGVLRYGETLREIGPGDCVSCPAGSGLGHQLANPFNDDLVYLAIGLNEPNEVCTYPDSGKLMIRGLGQVGRLQAADYCDGESTPLRIFAMLEAAGVKR